MHTTSQLLGVYSVCFYIHTFTFGQTMIMRFTIYRKKNTNKKPAPGVVGPHIGTFILHIAVHKKRAKDNCVEACPCAYGLYYFNFAIFITISTSFVYM